MSTAPTPSPGGASVGPQYAIDSLYYKAGLRTNAHLHAIVVTYLPNRFYREPIAYFPKLENAMVCVARIEEAAALTARVAELGKLLEAFAAEDSQCDMEAFRKLKAAARAALTRPPQR